MSNESIKLVMAEIRRRMDASNAQCLNQTAVEHFITHGMLMAVAIIEGKYRDGRWVV